MLLATDYDYADYVSVWAFSADRVAMKPSERFFMLLIVCVIQGFFCAIGAAAFEDRAYMVGISAILFPAFMLLLVGCIQLLDSEKE